MLWSVAAIFVLNAYEEIFARDWEHPCIYYILLVTWQECSP